MSVIQPSDYFHLWILSLGAQHHLPCCRLPGKAKSTHRASLRLSKKDLKGRGRLSIKKLNWQNWKARGPDDSYFKREASGKVSMEKWHLIKYDFLANLTERLLKSLHVSIWLFAIVFKYLLVNIGNRRQSPDLVAKQTGSVDQHPPIITRKVKGNPLSLMRSQTVICVLSGAVFLFTRALAHLKEGKKRYEVVNGY